MRRSYFAVLFLILSIKPLAAQTNDVMNGVEQREYAICMQQTRIDPAAAFEQALGWEENGGREGAMHCQAVALFNLGHFKEAADRLETLAKNMPDRTPPSFVADILGHAGLAWMQAGELNRAYGVLSSGLNLNPKNTALLVDRAFVLAESQRHREAINDLNAALALSPDDPDILTYRASAYRYENQLDAALIDLNRALVLTPDHPEALLERGAIYRLQDQVDLARKDWVKLIEFHEGRPAADLARRNLETMDYKTQ